MIEHIGIYVDNIALSDQFYRPLLSTLNYEVIIELDFCIAYGKNGKPFFEIYSGKTKSSGIHFAFAGESKEMVSAFYQQALQLGAKDNGKPGYRDYFPGYYAAFIISPEDHNIEVLFWDK